jgi:hypothetical protein
VPNLREAYGRLTPLTIPTYPALDAEPSESVATATYWQYRWPFWWAFVRNIFNRPELPATHYPRPEAMRASRAFEGALRIVPLSYLADVELPVDYPLDVPDEAALQARADYRGPMIVSLPASGPPVVARSFMPMLARAREVGVNEIAVKVFYV